MKKSVGKDKVAGKLEENREMLVPFAVLFIALILFIAFILPKVISLPSDKGKRDAEVARLKQIENAKNILANIDEEKLNSEVDLVSKTLPSDKNFELILGGISQAAASSGVQIASYGYQDLPTPGVRSENAFSSLMFEIKIAGGIGEAAKFADALYKSYPVAEVRGISFVNGVSTVLVSFYYRPFTSVNAQDAALARDKSPEEIKALQEISSWNEVAAQAEFIDTIPGIDDNFDDAAPESSDSGEIEEVEDDSN